MDVKPSRNEPEVFVPPPYFPDVITNGGIGYWEVQDETKGQLARVGPWQSMRSGDVLRLYWDGQVVVTHTVTTEREAFLINVPNRVIKYGPDMQTVASYCTVEIYPGGIEDESTETDVKVKLTVPGGLDPDQSTHWNENLAAFDGLPDEVQAGQAVTLTIRPWQNQTAGDIVTVYWGAFKKTLPVVTSPGSLTVIFTPDEIARGGDTDVAVFYEIRDYVNNYSKPSIIKKTNVDTGNRHPAPEIYDADAYGRLDLADLNGRPAQVRARYTPIANGDIVLFTWTGEDDYGYPLPPVTLRQQVSGPPLPSFVRFDVPYADVAAAAGGGATASYTVQHGGSGPAAPSSKASVTIVGTPVGLSAPTVDQADGSNVIDPLKANTLTVRVPATVRFEPGDVLIIQWKGSTSDGSREVENRFPWQDPTATIDTRVLPFNFGASVQVSYVIERSGQWLQSDIYTVFVARIADGDPVLPRPRSPQENPAGTLNLALFPGDAAFTVDQFRFADASQRYWLTLEGRDSNGGAVTWNIAEGEAFGSLSNPITLRSLDRTRLASLADGSTMIASLWVTYDGSPNKANAVKFRTTNFTIRQAAAQRPPAPTVVQADASDNVAEPWKLTKLQVHIPSAVGLQPGDQLRVYWNTGGNAGSDEVLITAPMAGMNVDIKLSVLAHNLGNVIPVKYAIIRGSQTLESITAKISVADLADDQAELGRPKVTQEDATGHIIDLSTFKGDADVIIATYPLATASQRYWLTASVEFAIGGRQDVDIVKGATVPYTGGQTISLGKLDRTLLDSLKGGSILTLTLWVSFNESANKNDAIRFRTTDYSIQLQESLKLLLPVVDRATGSGSVKNTLDPGDLIDSQGVAHRIDITLPKENGFKAGDTITLYWEDNTPQGSRTVVVPTVVNQDIAVLVDSDVMRFNHGHVVEVYFTVKRDGKDHNSPTLRLTVKRIPGNTTKFRRATIKQQDGLYHLNLSKFKGDGTLQIEPFAWLVSGMYYWIEARGRDKNGETKKYIEKTFNSVSGPQIYLGDVDRKWLDTLIDQSPFWIDIWVSFDGSKVKRDAVAFRSTNYTLKHK
ncbi:hypothetical protein KR767_15915 [Luteibacter anthropi]|uniref:hypothetical protein n=1 Tax=Luteibacter anthropi TaxID=564369 RepID=UPI0020322BEC|nr:hypothetical protein [Luteibacter anthropi]URX61537.1 hypothetical protein KR767_15915 [Luteibacter anthropi]